MAFLRIESFKNILSCFKKKKNHPLWRRRIWVLLPFRKMENVFGRLTLGALVIDLTRVKSWENEDCDFTVEFNWVNICWLFPPALRFCEVLKVQGVCRPRSFLLDAQILLRNIMNNHNRERLTQWWK